MGGAGHEVQYRVDFPSSPSAGENLPQFKDLLVFQTALPDVFSSCTQTVASPRCSPEDKHEGWRVGCAGKDPCQAGQDHKGQEEVGAAGAAGPGSGRAHEPVVGDAAAVGVVLQRGEKTEAAHLLKAMEIPGENASCHRVVCARSAVISTQHFQEGLRGGRNTYDKAGWE